MSDGRFRPTGMALPDDGIGRHRKLLGALFVLLIAIVIGIIGWSILPRDSDVHARGTIRAIRVETDLDAQLAITMKRAPDNGTAITILNYGLNGPPDPTTAGSISAKDKVKVRLTVPSLTWGSMSRCPKGVSCSAHPSSSVKWVVYELPVSPGGAALDSAQATFIIPAVAPDYGYPARDAGGHVSAELPRVTVALSGAASSDDEGEQLTVAYTVPGASTYLWSRAAALETTADQATWTATETQGLPAITASGIDPTVENADKQASLLGGALIGLAVGLAAGAIVALLPPRKWNGFLRNWRSWLLPRHS